MTPAQRRALEAMANERLFVWLVMKPETRAALQAAADDEYAALSHSNTRLSQREEE